jgi:hypothetical protein
MRDAIKQFLLGAGSVLVLLPTTQESTLNRVKGALPDSALEALRADWYKIGSDLSKVIQKLRDESGSKQNP